MSCTHLTGHERIRIQHCHGMGEVVPMDRCLNALRA